MLEEQEKQLESLPISKKAVKKCLHNKFPNILTLKGTFFRSIDVYYRCRVLE